MIAALLLLLASADDSVIAQGKKAFDAGRYTEAIGLWQKAGQGRCDVRFFLGLAYFRLKSLPDAILHLESSVACDARQVNPYVALAEAHAASGDQNRALAAYNAALNLAPRQPEALRGASAIYLARQMNDKAAELLEKLIQLTPNDSDAHAQLGAVYAAISKTEAAESHFDSALRLNADNASALTGLANVYLKTARVEKAVPLLNRAVSLARQSYEPWFLLGAAYSSQGKLKEALAAFQRAIDLDNQQPEPHYQSAMVYGKLERKQERDAALRRFRELKEQTQRDEESQRQAARLMEQARTEVEKGDVLKALGLLTRAVELQPQNDEALFRLAAVQFDLDQHEAARANVERAIRRAPGVWTYYLLLGLVTKKIGDLDAAERALEAATRLNSRAADAYNHLGDIAMRQGKPKDAVILFKKAAGIDPAEPSYRANLAAAERALTTGRP